MIDRGGRKGEEEEDKIRQEGVEGKQEGEKKQGSDNSISRKVHY